MVQISKKTHMLLDRGLVLIGKEGGVVKISHRGQFGQIGPTTLLDFTHPLLFS